MEQKTYWKGIEELTQDNAFEQKKHNEFPETLPIEDVFSENNLGKTSKRRDFLKQLGFSLTAATVAASCEIPVKKAIPYVVKPEEITPGVANWYASTFYDGTEYCSILVKTREGRPIKIEGNTLSPVTRGATNAKVQASVLNLYDVNRLRGPRKGEEDISWEQADKEIMQKLSGIAANEGNIRLLTGSIISPSTRQLINEFKAQYPTTEHITWDAVSHAGMLAANENYFGKRALPTYNFDKAQIIVSFDADFLGTWISPSAFTRQYIQNRKVAKGKAKMSRHYQFEPGLSITGSNADVRASVKPSQQGQAILNLYNKLAVLANASEVGSVSKLDGKAGSAIATAATELWQNRGRSLVVAGSNDTHIQYVVNAINEMLNSYGATIDMDHPSYILQGNDKAVMDLVAEMNSGNVSALFLHNVNPAYDHPMADKFAAGLKKVGLTVSFNERADETGSMCQFSTPDHHYLESWDDAMPIAGHYSLSQPTIAPLHKTRAFAESLLAWMGKDGNYYDYIKKYWEENLFPQQSKYTNFNTFWDKSLHDGVFNSSAGSEPMADATDAADETTEEAGSAASGTGIDAAASAIKSHQSKGDIEISLYEKVGIGDGKYANNPWLQELPDPISKVTWDNYIALSPKYAIAKGWKQGDILKITANNHSIELPVLYQPGQMQGTASIALGYGRNKVGKAGNGVGQNAFPFVSWHNNSHAYYITGATVEPTGKHDELAQTQTHHHVEGRPIVKETTLGAYAKNPVAGNEDRAKVQSHMVTLYPKELSDYKGNGPHWGMLVDLNSCVGCGGCVVACNAENNVPVVGKEDIRMARDMHWMRIDRYYTYVDDNGNAINKEKAFGKDLANIADDAAVEVIFQPMLCQHCDNAPCENVCPVAATSHSSEGLNQMAYNRCIGTRYCANNCPYKVRRFNWRDYTNTDAFPWNEMPGAEEMLEDLTRMVLNPDVTVRSRGVMEKCSFCVQRIQDAKLTAKREHRPLKDGDVTVACQQSCPAEAIVFGDMNDPESKISKMGKDERNYAVLEELHVLPSIQYQTKVRNKKA